MSQPYRTGQLQSIRELPPDSMAPVVSWDDFMNVVFDWQQGEHVATIGPTGSGKTTLTYSILPLRKYVVFFATKPRDPTLEAFGQKGGYLVTDQWPPKKTRGPFRRTLTPDEAPRVLLWPDARTMGAVDRQQTVFRDAFWQIYEEGGWCLVADELWLMTRILKLEDETRVMLQQARSNDISLVLGSQRPSRIPVEVFDQSTHLFFFRDNDELNLKRIGGVGWLSSGPIRAFAANLEPHQFLYVNTRKGWMYRSTAPELKFTRPKGRGRRG
jgi:hypothetical protein